MRAIVDTSVFLLEEGDSPVAIPDDAAMSVITLGELELGVLLAGDPTTRARRLRTFTEAARELEALPVDGDVAHAYAALVAEARRLGRRLRALDALIGATAVVHGAAVYTADRDFERLPGVQVVRVR